MLKKMNAKFLKEVSAVECVVAAFENDQVACVGWGDLLYSAIAKNLTLAMGIDPLFISQNSLINNWLAFGLRKDSQYTEALNYIATSYAEAGLVEKWKEDINFKYKQTGKTWISTQTQSKVFEKLTQMTLGRLNEPKPFRIENVQVSFIIFVVGVSLSSFYFFKENLNVIFKNMGY
ncbi:unnamed protein product [Allacma fusca]|uniref:Uncharacterized protein n=1 Tax=Allacma fusca TaxID=39272 RepID=A0A8J2P0V3_9HEXA|nr:unnamed protein product [Allacma fusca]